jgi:hypothetical protein
VTVCSALSVQVNKDPSFPNSSDMDNLQFAKEQFEELIKILAPDFHKYRGKFQVRKFGI